MSRRYRVVIPDYLAEASIEQAILGPIADIDMLQTDRETDLAARAADADALLIFHAIQVTEASIIHLSRCRMMIRCGVGFDNVDLEAAGRYGIVVCNVPDYGTEEVADHALMLLLAVARRLIPSHNGVVAGGWDPSWVFGAPRLRSKTLGLIGCGRIGSAVALRARAFGLRVVFHDPYQRYGHEKALGVERCDSLEDLLPQVQFLSLHCPLTRETRHIINPKTLALLPRGAYLVNTARGPCVDLDALLAALDSGQVAAAGLDVFEREPLESERIRRHPRVVLTPHAAYYSVEGYTEMRTKAAHEIRRALTGEAVHNPVNLHCLTNPRCKVPSHLPAEAR